MAMAIDRDPSAQLSKEDILSLAELTDVSVLQAVQGEAFLGEEADKLDKLVAPFLFDAVNLGLSRFKQIDGNVIDGRPAVESQPEKPFDSLVLGLRNSFDVLLKVLYEDNGRNIAALPAPDFFARQIEPFYQEIYNPANALSHQEKLALEYLIGFFQVFMNLQMSRSITFQQQQKRDLPALSVDDLKLHLDQENDGTVLGRIKPWVDFSEKSVGAVNAQFGSDAEAYWQSVDEVMGGTPLDNTRIHFLSEPAGQICSMRYIPQDPTDRIIVSMAQGIHWRGFGGSGDLLQKLIDNGTLADYPWLKSLCIGWTNAAGPFNDKLAPFKGVLGPLEQHEIQTIGTLCAEKFEAGKKVRILGFGSGPMARKEVMLANKLAESGFQTEITATEVDAGAIKSLAQKATDPASPVKSVRYFDFNMQPPQFASDEADLAVISIAAHQAMDSRQGHEQMAEVLGVAVKSVATGGLISWSDAGESVWLQVQQIPANVCDREGCVPPDIFARVKYSDVAAKVAEDKFKVPRRLSEYRKATPESVAAKRGSGVYEYNVFEIVEVPGSVLAELDAATTSAERDQVFASFFARQTLVGDTRAKLATGFSS